MTRGEIEEIAEELSQRAADNLRLKVPEGAATLDIPSVAAGMRLARDAFIETLKATAEASRRGGDKVSGAKALDKLAEAMVDFPIIGE